MLDIEAREALTETVQNLIGDREILLLVRFGSGLYGTETPDSDTDLRAVFLPTMEEVLMGETNFAIDSNVDSRALGAGDMDVTAFSLLKFLDMLGKFDMTAVEMLFASRDDHACLVGSSTMDWIYNSRESLLAFGKSSPIKVVRANLGHLTPDREDYTHCFREIQRAFGSVDGSRRLRDEVDILEAITSNPEIDLLIQGEDWSETGDQALEILLEEENPAGCSAFLIVRSRKIDLEHPVRDLLEVCDGAIRKQEKGAKQIKQVPPKKIYHAIRILDEMIELAADGELTFPRPIAPLLRKVRAGELPEDELRREISFYFNNGSEAERDLPFRADRCLETVKTIATRTQLDFILKGENHVFVE